MDGVIRIAAALIDDEAGRLLLVRKAGSRWFMQAGGKIEEGETGVRALQRELREEIGLSVPGEHIRALGRYSSAAANEAGCTVDAEIFHVRTGERITIGAEIAEAVWVRPDDALALPLAPLTRDHVLPLARALRSARLPLTGPDPNKGWRAGPSPAIGAPSQGAGR